jgi:signal transduction histidine kinase
MESTHLKTLLPALDLIHESKQLIITNYILLTGLIFLLITNVGCFVFLSGLREQKLSDTKKMLIGSRKKLATQNRDLKSFGAAASHFLQTPLYVSRLFLGKLKAGREEKSDAGAQRYFEMIDESLNQMEDFIKGFFAHYKIMEINSKNEQVDVLAELIRIKEVLLQKFPLAVISLPDEKIKLNTNRLLLIIILQNVMENGLKYNKSKLPEMEVSIIRINTTYSFLFTDNGIGIGQPFIETIFNPFVRIDHHTSEGTGLGLTGAKRAAEAINGELFCESSDGNGSTFRLNIDDRDLLKKI